MVLLVFCGSACVGVVCIYWGNNYILLIKLIMQGGLFF